MNPASFCIYCLSLLINFPMKCVALMLNFLHYIELVFLLATCTDLYSTSIPQSNKNGSIASLPQRLVFYCTSNYYLQLIVQCFSLNHPAFPYQ